MQLWAKVGVAVASIILACSISLVGFVFILIAPIRVYGFIYGRQTIENAPGSGAAFVFWCGPIAAAAAFFTAIALSFLFYRELAKRLPYKRISN